MKELVLACDLGTGGLKGAVFAADGERLAETFEHYPTYYPGPSLHEQKPAEWWDALVRAMNTLLKQGAAAGFSAGDIKAISLSGHSLGCIPVDEEGALLQDAVPLWSDGRAQDMARGDVLFAATGVTDGNMLAGVKFGRNYITTHTIVLRSSSRTVREIKARHQDLEKF